MFLYILLSNSVNVYPFSSINFICKSKAIIWLNYNDSKSVYIFLGRPVDIKTQITQQPKFETLALNSQ